jgi:hypothetical protein
MQSKEELKKQYESKFKHFYLSKNERLNLH